MEIVKLSKKGQISIPRTILRRLGIARETSMLVDVTPQGVIELRPATVFPIEAYSDARIAEFEDGNRMTPAEKAKLEKALAKTAKRA
ncbi:MAG: AbrB/MazE/SpoVT family DNA-binding domain-containing protein [Gammaproteobacteria bacterium]|nr:AbrB/MazE/SpoVT family DNA-binding domain-containing protein [Gammaproteobacteria bacterium]